MIKILVVEDFEQFRRFTVSTIMRSPNFHVTEASNGLEALQKAKALRPDLVLLDVGLPDLNGLEVARRIRRLAPTTKILFLSQETSPELVREALSLGALGYLHKSRAGRELLHAIDAALKGERSVSTGLEVHPDVVALPTFDIFSGNHDKNAQWIEAVEGLANANRRMQELAAEKPGKYFIFYSGTRTVVATTETFAKPEKPSKSGSSAA